MPVKEAAGKRAATNRNALQELRGLMVPALTTIRDYDLSEKSWRSVYLNPNELLHGALFGLCFAFVLGWYALGLSPIASLLWALSGANGYDKVWRRWVMPGAACAALAVHGLNGWALVSLPLAAGVLSIGYGIPCPDDKGSALGRFWLHLVKTEKLANIFTRGTIYVLLAVAFIPALILGRRKPNER